MQASERLATAADERPPLRGRHRHTHWSGWQRPLRHLRDSVAGLSRRRQNRLPGCSDGSGGGTPEDDEATVPVQVYLTARRFLL